MTVLLYQTDSYLREFEAQVTHVELETCAIMLDRTAFFPGGGGQIFDTGTVEHDSHSYRLVRARSNPQGIVHLLETRAELPPKGSLVKGFIDWERRFQVMRMHTAMHILCGVIFRDYGALVTGCAMEPLKGHMDFEFETMTKDLVSQIESAVNTEVKAAREVKVQIHDREEAFKIPDLIRTRINLLPEHIKEIRTIEIVGLDLQADGGTHVRNTREVGEIKIVDYKSKGKINKRIYIELTN